MKGFFLLVAFFLGCVLIVVLFSFGAGISARREAGQFERQAARATWRFLVPGPVKIKENPVPDSADAIRDGTQMWIERCVVCHANDGGGTSMGRSLHPPTPDLRKVLTQSLTDGELFYAIEQGIPFTGMPAWGDGSPASERESWALVRFIRNIPKLTPADLRAIEKYVPRTSQRTDRDRRAPALPGGKSDTPREVLVSR
ncbi:MAG TPA: c-type cytochrome [Vicinamibacterales bacterium]|nr:c-type cytochrome [Vicinamibacterales bacterium]